jgi:hypothetical protein
MTLPETLLHAFSAEPLLANDERFIGREEQLNRLLAALDLWRAGQSSMVAVTGPQGCVSFQPRRKLVATGTSLPPMPARQSRRHCRDSLLPGASVFRRGLQIPHQS